MENLLTRAKIGQVTYTACTDDPVYHPGRCAVATAKDGSVLARFGQVHPQTAANYGFSAPVFVCAMDFDTYFAASEKVIQYKPLPKFPAVTRDFSFICDEELEVGTVEDVMKKAAGKLVEDIYLFDLYRGPQVGENKKSVSLRVVLRASDRTLTQEEVDKVAGKILGALSEKLSINLRA